MSHSARIAFVGGGNMARSLIGARLRDGVDPASIRVAEPNAALREQLAADFAVTTFESGREAVRDADVVVLAVKPQVLRAVCEDLADVLRASRPLILSIAAGVRIAQIDAWLGGGFPIVRCMPNTPALVGAGASGLFANDVTGTEARATAEALLASAGSTAWVAREALMDVVTALSGSGPAYFFLLIEALEDAAVSEGLPRDTARALAVQTCLGAARMAIEEGESPSRLRERVTSRGGTTEAALETFAAGGLRDLVAAAVHAATLRGAQLSDLLRGESA